MAPRTPRPPKRTGETTDLSILGRAQGCACCANCAHDVARDETGARIEGQYVPCANCGGPVTSSRAG